MSSKGYATPLRLEVGANPILKRLYLAMASCAFATLLLLPVAIAIRIAALLFLLIVVWQVWRWRTELGGTPVQLVWDGEQRWWWTQEGKEYAAELQADSYLSTWLVVLNFRLSESRRSQSLVLTPAAIGDDLFRRMSVRFRITPRSSPE